MLLDDAVALGVEGDGADGCPVTGVAGPARGVLLTGLEVGLMACLQNGDIFPGVALGGRDIAEAAVAMFKVVPLPFSSRTGASLDEHRNFRIYGGLNFYSTLDLLNLGDSVATLTSERSWWARIFGRSFISLLVGPFFEKKNNAASIIAITLVFTVCYVIVVKEKFEYMSFLLNIVFVIIGYYFGAKQEKVLESEE